MIKKSLILAAVTMFAFSTTMATAEEATIQAPQKPAIEATHKCMMKPSPNKKAEFERRLKLTDEQKELAKEIRMRGHEEIKPIIDKMKALREEKAAVLKSRMAIEMQQEKLAVINGKLKELRKQAHDLRAKNMKEFEAILTDKQKKELAKMKKEGRKAFEKAKNKCMKSGKCQTFRAEEPVEKK